MILRPVLIMRKRILISTVILTALALAAVFLSLWFGARVIPFGDVWQAIFRPYLDTYNARVVHARIVRTMFGFLAGAALGVSGTVMQSVTRNPVADPSILGVNTGAALAVVIGLVFFNISRPEQYIWLALGGGGLTAALVYGIASVGASGITPIKLALSGATVSVALGSLLTTVLLPDTDAMNSYRFWQIGSIGAATREHMFLLLPFFIAGMVMALLLADHLNIVALGDEMASSLGVNVRLVRLLASAAGVVLCGATTALAGPMGFVGLMVPHLLRMMTGSDVRVMLPLSALGGASLLLIADVLGRIAGRPGETEVGVITALLGAPVFIYVIQKAKVRSL